MYLFNLEKHAINVGGVSPQSGHCTYSSATVLLLVFSTHPLGETRSPPSSSPHYPPGPNPPGPHDTAGPLPAQSAALDPGRGGAQEGGGASSHPAPPVPGSCHRAGRGGPAGALGRWYWGACPAAAAVPQAPSRLPARRCRGACGAGWAAAS